MAISLQNLFSSSIFIPIFLIFSLVFFLILTPQQTPLTVTPRRSIITGTAYISDSCSSLSFLQPSNGDGLFNYLSLHYCLFHANPLLSIPFLSLTLLLHFYILIKTAQDRFSLVVTKLCAHLSLSPSMGAVTLLALGNGAPDVFATGAAVAGGNTRTGFGAILSAGTFVSGLVVGFVGIYAAPFSVDPVSFVRDVLFYLAAASFLFYVYLSGELYFWQAAGLVGFYLFFVGFVFWMDLGSRGERKSRDFEEQKSLVSVDSEMREIPRERGKKIGEVGGHGRPMFGVLGTLRKISNIWEVPVSVLLKLTIPQSAPSEWSRFYQSANIALCPIALLYSCKSFMSLDHPIVFLVPQMHFPLWLVVLFSSSSLAILHYVVEKEPPKKVQIHVVLVAFVMSVFWISSVAGELLNCLAALGTLLDLPPSILGLTVLAWGNSVGDLVADVAVAKAGQPALAMAGCFAGPMFNMLIGLGSALVIQTAKVYPEPYQLHFHISLVVAFVFLFMSLMGSLLVITWSRFRVPRFWGFCLVGLYVVFTVVSLVIARFST